jgi:hypothetical protein
MNEEKVKLKYLYLIYGINYDSLADVIDTHLLLVNTMPIYHMLKFVLKSLYYNGGKHNSYRKLALDFGCTKRVVETAVKKEISKEMVAC